MQKSYSLFATSAIVASVAFCILMQEILLSRMFVFFIGNINTFMAIPITMLGLSVGSLIIHLNPKLLSTSRIATFLPLMAGVTLAAYLSFFAMFEHVFGMLNWFEQHPIKNMARIISMTLVFVPGFALGSMILTICFHSRGDRVGLLYAADLAASALACIVAVLSLHFWGLPASIGITIAAIFLSAVLVLSSKGMKGLVLLLAIALLFLGAKKTIFSENVDPDDFRNVWISGDLEILTHEWNEISRVTLMRVGMGHRLIHDSGESNVIVEKYDPNLPTDNIDGIYKLPFLMDHLPKRALVLFAGVGRDMVHLNSFANGELNITGVEISDLLSRIVTNPPFDRWNLNTFFALEHINYVVEEGRAFLDSNHQEYDLIFVASRGATSSNRFGNTRRYLDTFEAHQALFSQLSSNGLIIFHNSPFQEDKLEIVKELFARAGRTVFAENFLRITPWRRPNRSDTRLIKPNGFSTEEIARIEKFISEQKNLKMVYSPNGSAYLEIANTIKAPRDPSVPIPTDDRPYQRKLDFSNFTFVPDDASFQREWVGLENSSDWLKIFSLLFFFAVSALITASFFLRRIDGNYMPLSFLAYFQTSGICYMILQMIVLGKLELVLGQPIYAISVVLAAFLLFNSLGSYLANSGMGRWLAKFPALLPCTTIAVSLATFFVLKMMSGWGALVPFSTLIAISLLVLCPLAVCLGMFYPIGVSAMVRRNLDGLIPMSFGMSTISSVFGGCFALVMVINLGFTNLLYLAALGYGLVAVCSVFALKTNP